MSQRQCTPCYSSFLHSPLLHLSCSFLPPSFFPSRFCALLTPSNFHIGYFLNISVENDVTKAVNTAIRPSSSSLSFLPSSSLPSPSSLPLFLLNNIWKYSTNAPITINSRGCKFQNLVSRQPGQFSACGCLHAREH